LPLLIDARRRVGSWPREFFFRNTD
jgi:hypothetical protein